MTNYKQLLKRKLEALQSLCSAAYQVVSAANGPNEMLDNLSDAANGELPRHDPMAGLPWTISDHSEDNEQSDKIKQKLDELRYMIDNGAHPDPIYDKIPAEWVMDIHDDYLEVLDSIIKLYQDENGSEYESQTKNS